MDLINRDVAKQLYVKLITDKYGDDATAEVVNAEAKPVTDFLDTVPPEDARLNIPGHWVDVSNPSDIVRNYECSNCHLIYDYTHHLCPNCGAVMQNGRKRSIIIADDDA